MRVGILGSGAGATALALELSQKGFEVIMSDLPEFLGNIRVIKEQGGVYSRHEGNEKFGAVNTVDDIGKVFSEAQTIFVVTPAFGTKPFAQAAKPYVKKGHNIIVCPGSCGGALVFKKELGIDLLDKDIVVAETQTLPYAARIVKPGTVSIYLYVDDLVFTVLPSSETSRIEQIVTQIWPGVARMGKNVIETVLMNGNPVLHAPIALLNTALIERTKGNFRFYADGVTHGVANLIKAADDERIALGQALGIELPTEPEMSTKEGYLEKCDYWEGYTNSKAFEPIMAPPTLDDRYFNEDVGYGLVLWSSIGDVLGIDTPVIDGVIELASVVRGKDYRELGERTATKLGITKKISEEI